MASSELASTYAALILADDGLEITVRLRLQLNLMQSCALCAAFLRKSDNLS